MQLKSKSLTCLFFLVGLIQTPFIYGYDLEATSFFYQKKEADTTKTPTIADKTKTSKKIEGLFTLYQDTVSGKLQMLVMKNQLSEEFIYQSFSMGGPPDLFLNQNMLRETWVFKMEKVFDKIQFTKVNTNFYFDPTKAISKAANADVSAAKFFASKIIAKDSASFLIAVDDLYMGTLLDEIKPNFGPDVKPSEVFNIGSINAEKSNYLKIRSFPKNTDVVVSLTFDNSSPQNYGGNDITDARYVEVKMQHTFIEMPENDYRPRFDDPRVGYFYEEKDDMTAKGFPYFHDLITRWHLKKKNPEQALSEPIEPITWWVENTTPVEFRDVIIEAGLRWNEAFEKAGFKNAVVMKMMPDSASWDPADIRYNVIRWVSSDLGYAIGPSFVNPRTGQILGADITIDYGMLTFTLAEEALSQVAFGAHNFDPAENDLLENPGKFCTIAYGKKMQYGLARSVLELYNEDEVELETLSRQFMIELILHEMGHTMGLSHNMKASNMLSPEELNNKEITRKLGTGGSVMDYNEVNMSSDRSKQGDYYSIKTGPYDWWAIEYGYTPFDQKNEAAGLAKILSRSNDPQLTFGNDADIVTLGRGVDPRVMTWDQSSDIVTYAQDRFILVNNAMGKLQQHFVKPGASYHDLLIKFYMLQSQRNTMVNAVSRYVGGVYVDRSFPEQNSANQPLTPVPSAYQKSAIQLLSKYIFSPYAFENDKQVYPYLQRQRRGWNFWNNTEDPKLQNYTLGLQASALRFILNPITLSRVNTTSLYGNTYSAAEIIQDLVNASFDEDIKGDVNLFRQNLQKDLVTRLIDITENESKQYDHASNASAYYALVDLDKKLKKAKAIGNSQTQAHRASLKFQIEKSLKPKK